jgi:hypothetical protein
VKTAGRRIANLKKSGHVGTLCAGRLKGRTDGPPRSGPPTQGREIY